MSEGLGPLAPTVGWWRPAAGLNTKPTLTLERPPGICYAVCLTIEAERAMHAAVTTDRDPRSVVQRALLIAAMLPRNQDKPAGAVRDAAVALFGQEAVDAATRVWRA